MNKLLDYAQIISSFAMIVFSVVILYVASGAFSRYDNVNETLDKVELISKNADDILQKTEAIKQSLPDTVKESTKGIIDGLRDGLNKKE